MQSEVIASMKAGNDDNKAAGGPSAERKLELKICERCGGLWLRPAGSRWIYCGPCKLQVDELPPVSLRPPRKRGGRHANSGGAKPRTERVQ